MRIERVVVNASPLIVLFKSGLADLLPQLFTDILVPVAVWSEVASGKDQAAIARHGDAVIPDIVRGMEELQLLTALADDDFIAQVAFSGSLDNFKVPAQQIYRQILEGRLQRPKTTHVENRSQSLVTRVCDQDKLYVIESGALDFVIGQDHSVRLDRGEAIIVTRQRLHGTAVVSEECLYHIYDLGDYQSCLL